MEPEFVSVSQAAQELGISTETVRKFMKSGEFEGLRPEKGRWLVKRTSVDARLAKLGNKVPLSAGGPSAVVEELRELGERVAQLETETRAVRSELESAIRDRDHYRSEASTMRAMALHLSGTVHESAATLHTALAAMEGAQSDVLRALLAPGSPQDLPG